MIRVYIVATGESMTMTRKAFNKMFGKAEGKEILAGYMSAEVQAYKL